MAFVPLDMAYIETGGQFQRFSGYFMGEQIRGVFAKEEKYLCETAMQSMAR